MSPIPRRSMRNSDRAWSGGFRSLAAPRKATSPPAEMRLGMICEGGCEFERKRTINTEKKERKRRVWRAEPGRWGIDRFYLYAIWVSAVGLVYCSSFVLASCEYMIRCFVSIFSSLNGKYYSCCSSFANHQNWADRETAMLSMNQRSCKLINKHRCLFGIYSVLA
jgi:hypothetical protein